MHEFDGNGYEQEKQDTSDPHDDLPVDVRLAMTPEVIDSGGTDDRHDGTDGQHEGYEGVQHGSDVEGESDENTGNEKKKCCTDPACYFRQDVDANASLNLPVVIDPKGSYQSEDGTEYPAEFHQWEKQIGAHLLCQSGELQDTHWTEVEEEEECF